MIEVITKKPIWSSRLSNWHFGLNFWGSLLMFVPLMIGGFYQGILWSGWADGISYAEHHANISQMPFLQTVAEMYVWWVLRAIAGLIILVGNTLFLWNIYKTVRYQPSELAKVQA